MFAQIEVECIDKLMYASIIGQGHKHKHHQQDGSMANRTRSREERNQIRESRIANVGDKQIPRNFQPTTSRLATHPWPLWQAIIASARLSLAWVPSLARCSLAGVAASAGFEVCYRCIRLRALFSHPSTLLIPFDNQKPAEGVDIIMPVSRGGNGLEGIRGEQGAGTDWLEWCVDGGEG